MNRCDCRLDTRESKRTVTLLLARVEEARGVSEFPFDEMAVDMARLSGKLSDIVAAHDGVCLAEPGDGGRFTAAFAHASDAVACAVELQRAMLAPVCLCIGIHTGEEKLFFTGPTMDHVSQLCDFAQAGQTVISGATEDLVHGRLPERAWLMNLGAQTLHHRARLERVVQVCHPDTCNAFPLPAVPRSPAKSFAGQA